MAKTDNEKYVKRGADLFIVYDSAWEVEVEQANEGKIGAPYQYSETLLMLAAAVKVGLGVPYRQLEGIVGKMIGESKTPSFSQLYKRIARLDVNIDQSEMVVVSDKVHSRILAVDATGLKQHNRGEWMRVKWKKRRGFVKVHALVDTQTMKILALSVTDDSVGDSTMFKALLGQYVSTKKESSHSETHNHSKTAESPPTEATAGEKSSHSETHNHSKTAESPPTEATSNPCCKNHLASGTSPFTSLLSGSGDQDKSDLMLGDAAYGSRENVAACEQAGMTSGILHKTNVTARGKGSGDAWGVSVRDQLGGSPDAKRLDLMSQEEKKENQTYWKARLGYNMRWVVEGVFSLFKRLFGEHVTALKWENIIQEILLKVALYNKWRDESIARELGAGAL